MLYKVLIVAGIIILVAVLIIVGVGLYVSKPGYKGPVSDHFNGTTFENIDDVGSKNFFQVFWWSLTRTPGKWEKRTESELPPGSFSERRVEDDLKVSYVNHSTFLIQTDSLNILTDPVWSDRVSPFSFAGPERMRPPGFRYEDLPPVDAVLISHNHYDHLDIETLKRLKRDHNPMFIVPLGVDKQLSEEGIINTMALDWWESVSIERRMKVSAVPAQHFSARGLFDRDKTLWAGFVISTSSGPVYFAGDTGYGSFFPQIAERFGPVKLSLIPIGAYKPRWFMAPVHVDPAEALKVHADVQSEFSIGMHYGTFPLADDSQYDPLTDLKEALEQSGLTEEEFRIMEEGSQFTVPVKVTSE